MLKMVEGKAKSLLVAVVTMIVLIALLSGVTPFALTYLDNLSGTLVANGVGLGSLLAVSALGGILWFLLAMLIVLGTIFSMIKGAGSGK